MCLLDNKSCTGVSSKDFATVIFFRLQKFIKRSIPRSQCCFRSDLLTTDMVLSMSNLYKNKKKRTWICIFLFIDLINAFKLVSKVILLQLCLILDEFVIKVCPSQIPTPRQLSIIMIKFLIHLWLKVEWIKVVFLHQLFLLFSLQYNKTMF